MVEISIVVPTYQRAAVLRRSLPTVLAQDMEGDRFEVVVVVDGSTDGTAGFLESIAEGNPLRIVVQENRGLAAARNRGAREARGRVVLFLDDDGHATPGLASAHLSRHEPGGMAVVMGPFRLLERFRKSFLAAGVERWADSLAERLASPGHTVSFTDVSFANTSMPRALWESSGGFDETFRRFGNEDYEYGLRLLGEGVAFRFEPKAVAHQDYRKGFLAWCREWRDIGRADIRLRDVHRAAEEHLAFSRLHRMHPLRRSMCTAGIRGSRTPAPLLAMVSMALASAHLLGLRGRLLDLLKWLPADYQYGLGVREAIQERGKRSAGDLPGSLAEFFR